jgi:hypothetical protein
MVAADPQGADAEILYLLNLPLPKERITELIHHFDPILDPKGPERLASTRSLWSFLEWLHQPEFAGERLQELLECWNLVRSESGAEPASIDRWRDRDRELATQMASALEAAQLVERALAIYDQRFGRATKKLWRRALGWYRLTIPVDDFRILERSGDSIELLDASRIDSDRRARQLRDRFELDRERWQDLVGHWSLARLGELEREATEYWTIRLPESQDLWSRSRATLIARLQAFFEVLAGVTATARERKESMIISFSKKIDGHLLEHRALIQSDRSPAPILGPALEVEADSVLRRLAIGRGSTSLSVVSVMQEPAQARS